jgi:hypothetical protein
MRNHFVFTGRTAALSRRTPTADLSGRDLIAYPKMPAH